MPDTLIKVDLSQSPYENDMIHNRWHSDIPMVATVKPGQDFIICYHGAYHPTPYLVRLSIELVDICNGSEIVTCTRLESISRMENAQFSP